MIRALYLDAGQDWQVRLDDGVALHVSAPGRTRNLVPLRQLARVISPASAQRSTEALLACLRSGVPVLFHDHHGDTIAWCFGPRKRETTLGELLRETMQHPMGGDMLDQWRRSCERREILCALVGSGIAPRPADAANARSRLFNHHRLRLGFAVGERMRHLQRAAGALVAQQLHEHLGDPALIGFAREGLHMGLFLTELLSWRLHSSLTHTPRWRLETMSAAQFAAFAVERDATQLCRALGDQLGGLEYHLREQLT
jgi:hypothetical protein